MKRCVLLSLLLLAVSLVSVAQIERDSAKMARFMKEMGIESLEPAGIEGKKHTAVITMKYDPITRVAMIGFNGEYGGLVGADGNYKRFNTRTEAVNYLVGCGWTLSDVPEDAAQGFRLTKVVNSDRKVRRQVLGK